MRILLLGTTGYHPNERRHTPCLLVPECGVMLDAGTATFRAGRHLLTPELDVFLTHAHLDHVIGLTYLLSVMRIHPLSRITAHGKADVLRAVEEHLFAEALFPARPPFGMQPLDGPCELPAGGTLTYFPLEHRGGSVGYRLDWPDHSMAYVTDTTASPAADYVTKIRGVDLLIHECQFSDSQADWARKTGHSHTTPVALVAKKAAVGRLVLIHFNPLVPADDPSALAVAKAVFPETTLAEDEMELEF